MANLGLEVSLILFLIVLNGVFAMYEIAVVAARRPRLQHLAATGNRGASVALELANAPNEFFSTIQVGITLVGILAGALGGATLAEPLAESLERFTLIAPYRHPIAFGLVVVVITYLSLVVGELVPKRIALARAERIACALARPMRSLSRLTRPAVRLLGSSTDLVLRILRFRPTEEPPVTEEEIRLMIQQGTLAGVFEEAEQRMVTEVFRLADRRVASLMTPRTDIAWLEVSDGAEEIARKMAEAEYSRFPVCEGGLDNPVGFVRAKDLLLRSLSGQPIDLRALARPALFVPENQRGLRLLELFRQSGAHLALAIDEYGSIQGLVTVNDILEAIVGELPSREAHEEPLAVQREDGSWLLDGMLPVDDFKQLFHIARLAEEEIALYETLGGFVMTRLGRIPTAGDYFLWRGLRFEVVDMDGLRIDKVMVARAKDAPRPRA
jgi:putative hemolysin